jgi:hypothetical protein
MGNIPLDLQRRCEQRWAARFSRPVPPITSREHGPDRESQQIAASGTGKRKTLSRRVSGLPQRCERGTEATRPLAVVGSVSPPGPVGGVLQSCAAGSRFRKRC